jgi:uncharacterized protein YjiS (DUF1127 family)
MSYCIDTIPPRPFEAVTERCFQGALWFARHADRIVVGTFWSAFRARERAAQRHMLASLDDRMLKDLGISRIDAEREFRKKFWME